MKSLSAHYILKRLAMAVIVLFLVSVIVFVAVRFCPGDPVASKIGPYGDYSQENYDRVAAELGLDKPWAVQYVRWIGDCLKGDFGVSLTSGQSVAAEIAAKLPRTMELILVSLVLAVLLSIVFGTLAAVYNGSWFDQVIRVVSTGFLAVPSFAFGLAIVLLLAVELKWLPANGFVAFSQDPVGHIRYMTMPVLALALVEQASLTRYVRSEMLEVIGSNYIRTAKAKGLPKWKVYYLHAFKNVLVTVITLVGMRIGQLIGGAVIIEQIFGWSGIGWYLFAAINDRDYPAIQAVVLLIAMIMVFVNALVDVLYATVDKRIQLD